MIKVFCPQSRTEYNSIIFENTTEVTQRNLWRGNMLICNPFVSNKIYTWQLLPLMQNVHVITLKIKSFVGSKIHAKSKYSVWPKMLLCHVTKIWFLSSNWNTFVTTKNSKDGQCCYSPCWIICGKDAHVFISFSLHFLLTFLFCNSRIMDFLSGVMLRTFWF